MKPAAIFALLMVVAPARASTENTKQACSDGLDNDGDGRVDCADQDCWDLLVCAPPSAPRKDGYTKLVLGAVLLPLGVIIAGVSAVPYTLSNGGNYDTMLAAGVTLDVVAVAAIAAGTTLLAVGVGKVAGSHDRRAAIVPSLGPQSALLSLVGRF